MEDYIFNTTNEIIDLNEINDIVKLTFKKLKVVNPLINIVIVDNKRIKEINKLYRNIDKITDVISFAFEEEDKLKYNDIRFLGEIYISYEKCVSQADEYNHSVKRELCYLVVHGLLHLLGYDHMNEEDKKIMRAKEEEILNEYDIKR
ncbi:MAG: rRNA maturation RNase YbeY [Tenericutes bacterium]|nr:rRNA maturation RNase YbeY [Mycoplasmatota bacterium]